jgi:hypothetical protein
MCLICDIFSAKARAVAKPNSGHGQLHLASAALCAPYGRNIMPIFIVEIDSTNLKKSL